MAHDDPEAYGEGPPESFCRAPGERCINMTDCYSSKSCQYMPDDDGLLFSTTVAPHEPGFFSNNPKPLQPGWFDRAMVMMRKAWGWDA